jgi:hypothetical protein
LHLSLAAAAVAIIRQELGKCATNVFSYRGKPVRQVNT